MGQVSSTLPRLAYHALRYLEQKTIEARHARLDATIELRLALGYLHAVSGLDEQYFKHFWRCAMQSYGQSRAYEENYCRTCATDGAMNAICVALRVDRRTIRPQGPEDRLSLSA